MAKAPKTINLMLKFFDEAQEVRLVWGRYMNDRVALQLVDPVTGEPITTATVNLPGENLGDNETFIKNYAENEGVLESLIAAGIVEDIGRTVETGFVEAAVCRWLVNIPDEE